MGTPNNRSINNKPILGFYDFVFLSIGFLCLSLTTPILFRWAEFTGTKKWVMGITFFVGVIALVLFAKRPNMFRDRLVQSVDIQDLILIGSIWFFSNSLLQNFVKWGAWNMPPHRMLVVSILGFIAMLAAFCLFTRGSPRRLVFTFFSLGFIGLADGLWKFTTETTPKWPIPVPREYAYGSFVFAGIFLIAGLVAMKLQKNHSSL